MMTSEIDYQLNLLKAVALRHRPTKLSPHTLAAMAMEAYKAGEPFVVRRGGWSLDGETVSPGQVITLTGIIQIDRAVMLTESGAVRPQKRIEESRKYQRMLEAIEPLETVSQRLQAARSETGRSFYEVEKARAALEKAQSRYDQADKQLQAVEAEMSQGLQSEAIKAAFNGSYPEPMQL